MPTLVLVLVLVLVGVGFGASGCERSGYRYLESEDGNVFLKVPEEWDVTEEGFVQLRMTLAADSTNFLFLPGDDFRAWRVTFDATPGPGGSPDDLSGLVEVQPIDGRFRDQLEPVQILGFDLGDRTDGIEVLDTERVVTGDLAGTRVRYRRGDGESQLHLEALALGDERNSAAFRLVLGCTISAFEANREIIDEVLETFTVEG